MVHIFLYFLALFSLSTSPIWAKLNHMPTEILGFYRLLGATIIVILILIFKKQKLDFKLNKTFIWTLTSALFFFLHLWSYKFAAKHTFVANLMILFATNPVWASIGGMLFFKERINSRVILSYAFAFTGTIILVFDNLRFAPENTTGNIIALISAFTYAAYMISSKKAREHSTNTQYALVQYSVTATCFLVLSLITQASFSGYDSISWWSILGLIILPTFLGHYSFTFLVKHMNLAFMSCGKLIEPVIASILAYYVFSEKLGSLAYLAFALTGVSILTLFWPSLTKALSQRFNIASK